MNATFVSCHTSRMLHRTLRRALSGGALVVMLGTPAAAQENIPEVTAVDLGQSGIALFSLSQRVEGPEPVRFSVPRAQADDVLASLLVRDPAGGVVGLSTATPASLPESLRDTPFAAGLPDDMAGLLGALRGATVRIQTPRQDATGTVIGLGTRDKPAGEGVIAQPAALLLTPEGAVTEVVLTPGATVTLPDGAAAPLAQAARALPDADAQTAFELELSGEGPREVGLSYVTEAPAWKNSWRLLLDEGRLQGWATFENTSGHDWAGVEVTLSTGAPVAYRRDLLAPRRIGRRAAPDLGPTAPEVRPDRGFAVARDESAIDTAAELANAEAAPFAGAAAPALAVQGIAATRYLMPRPVDLPAGRTADLLYLDLAVSAEIQALYQPGQSGAVLLAVRLGLDQALAPGLVSVRDANGFVGDAPFAGLSAGQSRLLPYAAAPGAAVTHEETDEAIHLKLAATSGSLSLTIRAQSRTEYRATLPDDVASFAVEHPRSGRQLLRTNGTVEENSDLLRVRVPVENGAAAIEIVEEDVTLQQVSADREGIGSILEIAALGNVTLDAEDRAVIDRAGEAVATIKATEARLDDGQARYDALLTEQDRLRDNLGAVQSDDLRRRYEANLAGREDEIAAIMGEMDAARTAIRAGERELDQIIGQFQ